MPKTIADLPAAAAALATTIIEVQNGTDGQKLTMQQVLDYIGANVAAIKSIQTGYVNAGTTSATGEDGRYLDVTIAAVNINKCFIKFDGSGGTSGSYLAKTLATVFDTFAVTQRLTSTTNLRLAAIGGANIAGRWTIVEYN